MKIWKILQCREMARLFLKKSCSSLMHRRCLGQTELLTRSFVTSSNLCRNREKLEDGSSFQTEKMIQELDEMPTELKLSTIDEYRVPMKPFLKEVFSGRFNSIVLSYPDVLNNDRYFHVEQKVVAIRKVLTDRLDLVQNIDVEKRISKDILLALRSQGIFGHRGRIEEGGGGYCVTESLRMIEEVATANLSLSSVIVNSAWYGCEVIRRYGTEAAQKELLPRLHSGDALAALCVVDSDAGVDAKATSVNASYDPVDDVYVINGTKTWVTNAPNVELFIVWASMVGKNSDGSLAPKLTAFVVDSKNVPGVTVHKDQPYPVRGLKGTEICSVTFKNVTVPGHMHIGGQDDGFEVLVNSLVQEGKLATATQSLAACRKLLTTTIKHASERRQFGAQLKSFDLVSQRLGLCGLHLFALESAIYMTAGLADYQTETDVTAEATASRILASMTSRLMTDTCKRILGSATFLEGNQYTNLCDDLEGLEWWDSTLDLNCLYLGLSGLAYSGPDRQETVTVMRNRVLNFFKAIGHTMQSTWKGDNEPRLKMKLYEDVHPSLIQVAKRLEKLVIKFDLCVEIVLVHNGYNVHVMEADIARLATSASYIYGLTATLGRANRSYCDGHAHGDHEVNVAIAYSIVIEPIVMADLEYTARLEKEQIDPTIKYVSEYMSEQGCYAAVHPLTKNMF